jgi:hypothetical protein
VLLREPGMIATKKMDRLCWWARRTLRKERLNYGRP